ncbi:MAG: ATPase [Bacteroidales bacterium]|jgi:N-acetylglucosamine kinase-like BadF-type ATPase|nr:ATPase [Bacteroidales bacterium]
MILIADSGSTKITWSVVHPDKSVETCCTSGINPFLVSKEGMVALIKSELTLSATGISVVWFYGTGALPEKIPVLKEALSLCFDARRIEVNSDLLAAARALCGNRPGIACILGTGSNSCFYDGKTIVKNVPPLGYLLGDEGGGAYIGRKLLSDIFKNQYPEQLRRAFFAEYPVTTAEVLEHVYRKPFPNRYMAQFAKFVAGHLEFPEMEELVCSSFSDFFRRNLMQYSEASSCPVHFTGSIAFYFRQQLEQTAASFGWTVGTVCREPMPGLIDYHLNT